MVISDLQHIESAAETEVQGGCLWCKPPTSTSGRRPTLWIPPECPYNTGVVKAQASVSSIH